MQTAMMTEDVDVDVPVLAEPLPLVVNKETAPVSVEPPVNAEQSDIATSIPPPTTDNNTDNTDNNTDNTDNNTDPSIGSGSSNSNINVDMNPDDLTNQAVDTSVNTPLPLSDNSISSKDMNNLNEVVENINLENNLNSNSNGNGNSDSSVETQDLEKSTIAIKTNEEINYEGLTNAPPSDVKLNEETFSGINQTEETEGNKVEKDSVKLSHEVNINQDNNVNSNHLNPVISSTGNNFQSVEGKATGSNTHEQPAIVKEHGKNTNNLNSDVTIDNQVTNNSLENHSNSVEASLDLNSVNVHDTDNSTPMRDGNTATGSDTLETITVQPVLPSAQLQQHPLNSSDNLTSSILNEGCSNSSCNLHSPDSSLSDVHVNNTETVNTNELNSNNSITSSSSSSSSSVDVKLNDSLSSSIHHPDLEDVDALNNSTQSLGLLAESTLLHEIEKLSVV